MHFFVDLVRSRIPSTWKASHSGWVSGDCPMCVMNGQQRPDTKKRGGFHFGDDEWVYHCFNCKFKTGWSVGHHMPANVKKLLKQFGLTEADIQRASLELLREEDTTKLLNPMPEPIPPFVPTWPEVELPKEATFLLDAVSMHKNFEKALVMLNDRQLLHWTDWAHTSKDLKFRNRIILPYRYKGMIVGHNARFIGTPPDGKTPKYMLSKPMNFVFNLDKQNVDRNALVVVEGDFDAISIDAVSLGSNSLSEGQASLINQLRKKTILLPDADLAGRELIEPAIEQGWFVSFPEWMGTHKDANSAAQQYGRAFVLKSTIEAATDNPTKIRVLAKKFLVDN
jgi:hypothetical protein